MSHTANALNAWPSWGAAPVGGWGAFRKWGLHGRSRPLRVGLGRLQTGPRSCPSICCFIPHGMRNLISSRGNGMSFPPRLQTGADPLKPWLLPQVLSVRCRGHQDPAPPYFSFCVKKKKSLARPVLPVSLLTQLWLWGKCEWLGENVNDLIKSNWKSNSH